MIRSSSWSFVTAVILTLTTVVSGYRPIQHCRHIGENGHYSACTALTQHYNTTTQQSDLFIRYHWYKYKESKNGWHAFAIGEQMAGALMFTMYGDPTSPVPEMTFSIRSAEGHHSPQLVSDMSVFKIPEAKGRIPDVDVITSTFRTYDGPYEHPELHLKPTHVGVAEFIVRSYAKWIGTAVSNSSTAQPMIWSSRYDQDFNEDYSIDRSLDMHAFGMGFGFLRVDLLNAMTPLPMFGAIDERSGLKGLTEIGEPLPPTPAELSVGEFAIKNARLDATNAALAQATSINHRISATQAPTPSATMSSGLQETSTTAPPSQTTTSVADAAKARLAWMLGGKTARDWMWHLHGFMMASAFLGFYPLGVYLLRSQKQITAGESFNYHWTVQALGTVMFALSAFLAFLMSHSIHNTHQYIGLFIAFCIGVQMLLGWRHHIKFMQIKRKTIMSKVHVGMGRVLLPVGFINILSGLKLREYGWFTMLLVLITMLIEIVFGAIYLRGAQLRRQKLGGAAVAEELKAQGPGADDDAEEYFKLADDDELSDMSDGEDLASKKREQKREENARLARLDRV